MYEKYNRYKDSGVEWLGMVPEHWEMRRFKFLFNEINERSENGNEDLLSVSQYTGVTKRKDKIEEGDLLTTATTLEGYKKVYKGDLVSNIMLAWNGSLGFSPYEGITSPAYSVYRLNKNTSIGFFHYLLRSEIYKAEFKRQSSGIMESRLRLYTDSFYGIWSVLPPLSEQMSIATFLDKKTSQIDHAIELKEKTIALLKEHKQIMIQELVTGKVLIDNGEEVIDNGELKIDNARLIKRDEAEMKDSGVKWIGMVPRSWEVKRLKHVCNINKKTLPDTTRSDYELEYIDIGNVSFENGIERSELYTFKNAPSRARRKATKGSTIISTVRTYLKAIDYINQNKSKYIFSTGFAVLEPNELINGEFLYNFVLSDAFTEQVSYNSKGMSYPAINSTELGKLFLLVPELTEQTQIVYHVKLKVKQIDHAISLQEQEIEKLKELKATLIDSAVTGKIKIVDNG